MLLFTKLASGECSLSGLGRGDREMDSPLPPFSGSLRIGSVARAIRSPRLPTELLQRWLCERGAAATKCPTQP